MMSHRIVIVGNGMACQSLCDWLTREDAQQDGYLNEIVVFGDEPRPAYDRVQLTSYISQDKTEHELELEPRAWYQSRGIELRTGERIDSIDRVQRELVSQTGQRHRFDTLILATGSYPFVPPIPGVDLSGVHLYRTIEDLQKIRNQAANAKTAAVIGGGLLGLEAARALRDLGLIPHVVEVAPSLMPRQLDRECGDFLGDVIERMGVHVHLLKRMSAIERHGDYLIVRFNDGDTIAVDLVVISAGIRPRDELAAESGLKLGPRGGIVVDDRLRTSDPSIYAIGECANHRGIVYGLVGPCVQMARVLASRLNGKDELFLAGDQSAKLKVMGTEVVSLGVPLGDAVGVKIVSHETPKSRRKLLIKEKRLVGALGVGPWREVDLIRAAISSRQHIRNAQLRRFQTSGELWPTSRATNVNDWPADSVVCSCQQVKRSALTSAIQQGRSSVEALSMHTQAGTACGTCKPLLAQMLGLASEQATYISRWRGLFSVSCFALVCLAIIALTGPIEYSQTVDSTRHQLDLLWRDSFWKQVSGYTLLSITILSLLFSLRKRMTWFSLGEFGTWRTAHAFLGLSTIAGILFHTGFHLGSNLNFFLMMVFLVVNLMGAITGLLASLESRLSSDSGLLLRRWRSRLTWTHILAFWPLPILVVAHVFSVYFY